VELLSGVDEVAFAQDTCAVVSRVEVQIVLERLELESIELLLLFLIHWFFTLAVMI
jgi:hypothetical protein